MNRICLDKRLVRIERGRPSDPAVARQVLEGILDVPIRDLAVEKPNIEIFADALDIDTDTASAITCGEASVIIHNLWERGGHWRDMAGEALVVFIRPYLAELKRRQNCEKNKP